MSSPTRDASIEVYTSNDPHRTFVDVRINGEQVTFSNEASESEMLPAKLVIRPPRGRLPSKERLAKIAPLIAKLLMQDEE